MKKSANGQPMPNPGEWVNGEPPPRPVGRRPGWRKPEDADAVAELKAKPGAWAVWPRTFADRRCAYAYTHALKRRFPGVDAVTRTVNGETLVFACWPKAKQATAPRSRKRKS